MYKIVKSLIACFVVTHAPTTDAHFLRAGLLKAAQTQSNFETARDMNAMSNTCYDQGEFHWQWPLNETPSWTTKDFCHAEQVYSKAYCQKCENENHTGFHAQQWCNLGTETRLFAVTSDTNVAGHLMNAEQRYTWEHKGYSFDKNPPVLCCLKAQCSESISVRGTTVCNRNYCRVAANPDDHFNTYNYNYQR